MNKKITHPLGKIMLCFSAAAIIITTIPVTDINVSASELSKASLRKVSVEQGIEINSTNFPDDNFRKAILDYDYNKDGMLDHYENLDVTSLNLYKSGIKSLKGIEYLSSLTSLTCGENNLTSLDISKNTALTYLSCSDNKLTSLDVSKNTELTNLYCEDNNLSSLDISNNTNLDTLWCSSNQIKSFDLSKNTKLTTLICSRNLLKSLDLSKNTELTHLSCDDNKLKSLDISKCVYLTRIFCYNNNLKSLDLSKNTELTDLSCASNLLTTLNLSKNTALTSLSCGNSDNLKSVTTYANELYLNDCKKLNIINLKTTGKIITTFKDVNPIMGCTSLKKIVLNKKMSKKTYSSNVKTIKKWLKSAKLNKVKIVKG